MPHFASPQLSSLDLSFNKFTGAIPDALAQHPSLASLDLKGNQLSGWAAAWQRRAGGPVAAPLKYLRISSNPSLEGGFPLGLAAYPKLVFLLISENRLRWGRQGAEFHACPAVLQPRSCRLCTAVGQARLCLVPLLSWSAAPASPPAPRAPLPQRAVARPRARRLPRPAVFRH